MPDRPATSQLSVTAPPPCSSAWSASAMPFNLSAGPRSHYGRGAISATATSAIACGGRMRLVLWRTVTRVVLTRFWGEVMTRKSRLGHLAVVAAIIAFAACS